MKRTDLSWRKLAGWMLIAVGVAGCGQPDAPLPEAPSAPFQLGAPVSNPEIVAVVLGGGQSDTLRAEQFNDNILRLHSMFPDVMSDPDQEASIKREIVKQFVLEKLILSEAATKGVEVDSVELAGRMNAYRATFADNDAYQAELERFGQSEDDLREQFRIELTRDAISRVVEDQTADPTTDEVEAFRESMAERLLTQHILFMVDEGTSESERVAIFREAEVVLDSAITGESFGNLARRHSDDVGTARLGGELPWFRRGEMVEGFEEAAFQLEDRGDITDELVRTTYGYHIIRLIDRKRDELMPADSARIELRKQRVRKAERALLNSLQESAEVRVNPELVSGF